MSHLHTYSYYREWVSNGEIGAVTKISGAGVDMW